jgi:Flp pilus assembly protein TadB
MTSASWLYALPLLLSSCVFIALPAAGAWRRRQLSRLAAAAATDLAAFADRVRREQRCLPPDDILRQRLRRLGLAEVAPFHYALDIGRGDAGLLADVAQRLASRLRRRVAFERKMLARTAPGLRRGAIAASLPPIGTITLALAGVEIPAPTLGVLLAAEMCGCLLLWHWARVEI